MIEILLVDDRPTVRRGLCLCLELDPEFKVIGQAGTGMEAMALAQALQPQVIVMDVEMPAMDGIETARRLRELAPGAAVILLSVHDDIETRARAREAGALAFVEKQGPLEELIAAIRQAALGSAAGACPD